MRWVGVVWLAVASASAQTLTTVPQIEVPVGGPTGSSVQGAPVQGVSGQGPALISPALGLTPSIGASPVPTIAPIVPVAALNAVRPAPSAEVEAARAIVPGALAPEKDGARPAVPGAEVFDQTYERAALDLDEIEARQGEAVVDALLRDHDPAEHDFVGVGRSPAILVALMQNRAKGLAHTLPLSDFYHHPGGHKRYYPPLTRELETKFFDHLDRFLPSTALSGVKTLVLLDFVKGGRSMIALDEYLKRYAERRYPVLRWKFFGLSLGDEQIGFTESGRSYRVLTPKELDEAASRPILHTRLSFSWNKDLAEYGEFAAPFENAAALERRAEYEAWRERLARRKPR